MFSEELLSLLLLFSAVGALSTRLLWLVPALLVTLSKFMKMGSLSPLLTSDMGRMGCDIWPSEKVMTWDSVTSYTLPSIELRLGERRVSFLAANYELLPSPTLLL
mgnify:CR=1 FL=1